MSIETGISSVGLDRTSPQPQPSSDIGLRQQVQAGQVEKRAIEASANTSARQGLSPSDEAQAVQDAAEQIGQFLTSINSDLNISVDRDVNTTVVKVVNRNNSEVIRQIPSEEVLSLMRRMSEIAQQTGASGNNSGVLLSDQV